MRYLTREKVEKVAELADQSLSKRDREGAMLTVPSPKADALVKSILSGPTNELSALMKGISALSEDELAELTALMLVGRDWQGSFDQAFAHAAGDQADRPRREAYVIGKRLKLSQYLRKGLERASSSHGS